MPIGGTATIGANQSPRITTNYLNQLNRRGDPGPGLNVSTAQVSGSIVQPYGGFEGGKLTITNPWAPQFADPAVGPIYGGIYMYVQLNPIATFPLHRGEVVFWFNELRYIVTGAGEHLLPPPPVPFKIAGVALNETFPGYWDFIQILGIASVRFNAAGAIGDTVRVNRAAIPPQVLIGDSPEKDVIGTAVLTAPHLNLISPVELNIRQGLNF
jgi:hypothetical protein